MLRPSYDECLKAAAGVVPDMQDCIGAEHEYQDGRLNKVYQTLMSKLDKPGQLALRAEQRKWLLETLSVRRHTSGIFAPAESSTSDGS